MATPVDRDEHQQARWRISDVVVGWIAAVVASGIGAGIAIAAGADEDGLGTLLAGQAAFWAVLCGAVVLASRRRGTGSLRRDVGLVVRASDAVRGLPAGLATQLLVLPLLYLPMLWLLDDLDLEGPAQDLLDRGSGWAFAALVIGVIVVAPVVEELFYRGLLLRTLEQRYSPSFAVALTAVVFGITHFQLVQLLGLIAAGGVFGWLAARHGRLGPAIFAHAGFNAVTVIALTASG